MPITALPRQQLPRLASEYYQGRSAIFWTHTVEHRATGWLSELFHAEFRVQMLHAAAREQLLCPVYVLMPDHLHLIWLGVSAESDQRAATAFLRTKMERLLAPRCWQHQPHDHVLRADERKPSTFAATCAYLAENPVRANLAARSSDWPFIGCVVPGYPDLHPLDDCYWVRFWRIYDTAAERGRIGKAARL